MLSIDLSPAAKATAANSARATQTRAKPFIATLLDKDIAPADDARLCARALTTDGLYLFHRLLRGSRGNGRVQSFGRERQTCNRFPQVPHNIQRRRALSL